MNIVRMNSQDAGFEINEDKTVGPAKALEFLGIVMDIPRSLLAMSHERIAEVKSLLKQFERSEQQGVRVFTKRELLSLLGKLNFCQWVIKDGRFFVRRLIHLSKKPKFMHHRVTISSQAVKDVQWWLRCMESHNWTAFFPVQFNMSTAVLIFSDASDWGVGMMCGDMWSMVQFTGQYEWLVRTPIAYREMAAVVWYMVPVFIC